ncbi:aminoglycoside N(3)-acetyltransferase [Evansella cellulosilytica]|uniref:Aminoglycoside N(3)-acetyltransferase n=1 Tax=Evansella cellulosilytica (strain ATCC 21833 / DSM 2522 / FERM P-1141 / JCM 9156 / N-4) TaxID=649639 RepID=E6TVM6_EVAC2|nr:AAC(3) family N-acetyltransferase [Evansella cellulosilytica]ADU32154.1 aminoglycoside 3-N-acetyltransferase [Evansella cellulosilytica DSM 2522]
MNLSKQTIKQGFNELGLTEGSTVLVHSSLKSFGYVEGGAITVIESLLETVGPEGNVIVPTLTGEASDSKETPPQFDVSTTPCWTGVIPETFRNLPEARRSLHPTHSVAVIGSKKHELVSGHETSHSPCDKTSPYYKNAMEHGYIMLIGVDQESNTTIHTCEEIAQVPYHLQKETTTSEIIDEAGGKITVKNKLHDWTKPPTNFNKLDALFESKGIMTKQKIGNATTRLINANSMLQLTLELLTKDPHYMLTSR